jgi:SNF2 family DNA or RNA helicase
MNVALEATADAPKKKRKKNDSDDVSTQSSAGPSSSKGKGKEKAKPPKAKPSSSKKSSSKVSKAKKPRRNTHKAREWDRTVKQMTSLMSNDVFRDQAAEDAAEQPTFTATRKNDALKELIASVPLENQKAASSDRAALLAATKDLTGKGAAKPKDGLWLIKGMKTALKPYQLMGTAFMRRRENATEEPRGGLMADQMGLGKTLMMLANIVNGRAAKNHPHKTTLLVASPNLLTQWAREIQTHVDEGQKLSVLRYSYGSRIVSNCGSQILANHDIILTTYNEVMRSYPKNDPPEELQTAEEKMAWWKQQYEEHRGVLHRMMFYRVVLDEAQVIKNHTSRTSIACRALMAEHKWALSGTPILNSLTELYPYFKFLGVPYTGSFRIFKHNYCDPGDSDNTERLLVRLSQFMIRRNHSDSKFIPNG